MQNQKLYLLTIPQQITPNPITPNVTFIKNSYQKVLKKKYNIVINPKILISIYNWN